MPVTRRQFLQTLAAAGGGLLVGCSTSSGKVLSAKEVADHSLGVWLHIASDGAVTFVVPSSEMGQGVTTSLTAIVAEELEVDFKLIQTVHAHASPEYNNPQFSTQGTGGSTSIVAWWAPLQKMAAAARQMLVQAAAQRWQVEAGSCTVENAVIFHPGSNRQLAYANVVKDAANLVAPDDPVLKDPANYRYIGKPLPRKDGFIKVTGQAQFGIDVRLPGMLYATVRQSPVFGASVTSIDKTTINLYPGVVDVVDIPNGVAIVANNFWAARKAAQALKVEFSEGVTSGLDDEKIYQQFASALASMGKAEVRGERTLDVEYEVPYLAHATMEPMNCTADVRADGCTVWVPSQFQGLARSTAADITGLDEEKVRVNTTYLGGGFGRRAELDFVIQAVTVSKAVGKPVQVIWTREEDTQHDFYRPAYLSRIQLSLKENGYPDRFEHQLAGPALLTRLLERSMGLGTVGSIMRWLNFDTTSTEGASELPYSIENHNLDYTVVDPGVPVGFWRSVGSSHNAFTTESVIDEAAHLAGIDPYQYRHELLKNKPRHQAVLERVAEEADWYAELPEGYGRGIALHKSFGSIVGQVVEVSVKDKKLKIHKVHCVIDCGRYVNPDIIEAQLQGAVVQALSSTLDEKISIKNGAVSNSNFHDYPVLRLDKSPDVTVSIMQNDEDPGGVGEPGVPPLVPAVCNGIYAATGKRIRKLPIGNQLS